jgi:hypothetical protein
MGRQTGRCGVHHLVGPAGEWPRMHRGGEGEGVDNDVLSVDLMRAFSLDNPQLFLNSITFTIGDRH